MYKSLNEHLHESEQQERVDESLTLLAVGLIAFAAQPVLKKFGESAGKGVGSFFGGLASLFGLDKESRDKRARKKEEKEKKKAERNQKDSGSSNRSSEKKAYDPNEHGLFANLLALAKKKTTDKANGKVIDLLQASSVDKDGNPIPMSEMANRMAELTGSDDPAKLLKDNGVEPLSEEDAKKVEKGATEELSKMSKEERDKVADEELKKAKQVSKAMQQYKDKQDKLEKDLEEAKNSGDKDKIKAAQDALDKHKSMATGPAKSLADTVTNTKLEPKKDGEGEEGKTEPKKDSEGEPEPKKDGEPSKDKKKKRKNKKKKEKGPDGEPAGTTAKEEEVTDPKTGKKKKAKVYTGPKGGRYYYPKDAPHTPEHKVYVEAREISIVDYIYENLE